MEIKDECKNCKYYKSKACLETEGCFLTSGYKWGL